MFITPTRPSGGSEKLQFKSGYVLHSDFQDNQGCAKLPLSRPASLHSLSYPQLPLSPSPNLSAQKEIKGPQILCFHVVLLSPQEALIGTQQQRERLRGFTNELPNSIQVPGLTMEQGCRVLLGRCSLTVFPFFETTHASPAMLSCSAAATLRGPFVPLELTTRFLCPTARSRNMHGSGTSSQLGNPESYCLGSSLQFGREAGQEEKVLGVRG